MLDSRRAHPRARAADRDRRRALERHAARQRDRDDGSGAAGPGVVACRRRGERSERGRGATCAPFAAGCNFGARRTAPAMRKAIATSKTVSCSSRTAASRATGPAAELMPAELPAAAAVERQRRRADFAQFVDPHIHYPQTQVIAGPMARNCSNGWRNTPSSKSRNSPIPRTPRATPSFAWTSWRATAPPPRSPTAQRIGIQPPRLFAAAHAATPA